MNSTPATTYPTQPSTDDLCTMADEIAATAAHVDVATHRLITLIRGFDEVGGWHRQGALSCAHWLSWRIGMGRGAAREKVRVARALASLPKIDAAFAAGEVSYSKVRAMTRVATAKNEDELLRCARNMTAAQLEKTCRLVAQVRALDGTDARAMDHDRRFVVTRPTDDGLVDIRIRVTADEAARIFKAIEVAAADGPLVDGAVALADAQLAGDATSGRPPVEAVIHIDAATLDGHTELGDGVPAETCRRLLCDAGIVAVTEDSAGKTLDVGRKTRVIPAAIRRALHHRDGGCRFPGCSNVRFVDAHHIEHWIHGGETRLDNLVLLCRRHHRYLHEHGYAIELDTDRSAVFRDPHGRVVHPAPPMPTEWVLPPLPDTSAETNAPGWDGDPIDYGWCVEMLVEHGRAEP